MDGEIFQIPEPGTTVFVIRDMNGEKKRFQYTGFFPIRKGDMISVDGEMNKKTKGTTFILKEKPLVFIPQQEEHIIKYFRDALNSGRKPGGGKKFKSYPKDIGEKIYQEMIQKLGDINKVLEYLNNGTVEFYVTIDDTELQKIYRWWDKSVLRRQLYLIGLYNYEIDDNPALLFQKISHNPAKVSSISMDRVFEINKLFRRETSEIDIECGQILRKLIEFKKKGRFYVGEKIIKELFPSVSKYKEYLTQEYDIIFEDKRIYTRENYNIEFSVASRISEMIKIDRMGAKLPLIGGGAKVHVYGKMKLTNEQMEALKGTIRYQICIITGGAGCGKTTLLREIVDNLENKGRKILLTSFTGKAVMRMKEVVCHGRSKECRKKFEDMCVTLSRLIHKRKTFQKTPDFDTLIIDESSMVPTGLIYTLFSYFPNPFKIILVGDCNQLDPIEAGSFFKELIDIKIINTFRLTKNMRTDEGSVIVENASALVDEERNFNKPFKFNEGEGFYIVNGDIEIVSKIIKGLWKAKIDSKDITILCPVNKYLPFLSMCSQKYYLKKEQKFKYMDKMYYYGDRMMQKKNFYSDDVEIMNGEEGYITNVTEDFMVITFSKDKVISYRYPDVSKQIPGDENIEGGLEDLTLDSISNSFAKTIHKSQGSEYEYVIIYLPPENYRFVSLNMLYTAITRAKKKVWIVAEQNIIDVITTQKLPKRYETLGEKILNNT